MKRCGLGFVLIFLCAVFAHATLTIHIQSPWRDDATKDGYFLHILGAAGGGYNASYGPGSTTITTNDGDGWFTYTWDKTLADFQEWMNFTISLFPNTEDANYNNNNGIAWKEAGEIKMNEMFGADTEIWLYTNTATKTFTRSYVAPGSKLIWFKSPWGNRALPQLIFGTDSVLMRFAVDDDSKCGWFYGAITPEMVKNNTLGTGRFIRYKTPHMIFPKLEDLSFSAYFDFQDTVYVDGTSASPSVELTMGTPGSCFDSTRTLHIYHPWRTNTTYRDSLIYISVGSNIINNPTAVERDQYQYWFKQDFASSTVASSNWVSSMAVFNIFRRQNEGPQVKYFNDNQRIMVADFFPNGVYETWLFTSSNGRYELVYSPLEPKVVRLLSPWDNMSPSLIVANDTIKMGPISPDTCGWYQGIYYKHTDDWSVMFKQTFGMEHYAGLGIVPEGKIVDSLIVLDEMMQYTDTMWIYPHPVSTSPPAFDFNYPNRLGICPSMKISALVLDWAGESFDNSIDVDFGGIYGGNEYTTITYRDSTGELKEAKTCGGLAVGMVRDTLVNGVPARVDSADFPWGICSAGHEIEKWFVPQVLARGDDGTEYTNAVCRDIDLTLDAEGFWLADITEAGNCNDSINPGFYPIDDFQYLDPEKKFKNPKYDWAVSGCMHNYSFSMKISAQFRYVRGQYFEFRGDDDVWVFIDNRLVVDIGGCHSPIEGAVDLDTMNLVEGQEYPFHIFFSERNATGSNFKMRTSINLQTQKTYLPRQVPHADGLIEFNILQLLVDESISCDVSSTTKVDTTLAQSIFTLYDGAGYLPKDGKSLNPGMNYGGILINENMAGFVIDTNAIVRSRSLPSGKYVLRFALASDLSQYSEVVFTVPEYPMSEVAFVNEFDETMRDEEGKILRHRTDSLGEFAFVTYPVRITLLFLDSIRDSNVVTLDLKSSDSLVFFNMKNEQVTTIETDGTGFANFYVMGTDEVKNGSFTISGVAVADTLTWSNINLVKPPVPYASNSYMFDRNGDGIPDSLCVFFNEKFDDDIPDTLDWTFGDSTGHKVVSVNTVKTLIQKDSLIVITGDELLNHVFTGKENEAYSGGFRYHYTHVDEESGDVVPLDMKTSILDKVGPILQKAIIVPESDNYSRLTLLLSEGFKYKKEDARDLFEFKIWRMGVESSAQATISFVSQGSNLSQVELLFFAPDGGVMPTVGDSIRLVPGGLADLSENTPHKNNPWVRITGEPRVQIDVPGLMKIYADTLPKWNDKAGVKPIAIATEANLLDVTAQTGLPGHLIHYALGELVLSDEMLSTTRIKWEVHYYTNLGQYVNGASGVIACNDSTVFNLNPSRQKNCRDNPGNIFLEWNARSDKGRFVGTGAYISKLSYKVISNNEQILDKDDTYTLGIKRQK